MNPETEVLTMIKPSRKRTTKIQKKQKPQKRVRTRRSRIDVKIAELKGAIKALRATKKFFS